jgi:hypothetical protein|nr:MAG TPA: hypothetical protein [Caudoviricetes sp.]
MMQIINNTGAIIGEQINLGNIDDLNIDDLFKDNTNNKKMKKYTFCKIYEYEDMQVLIEKDYCKENLYKIKASTFNGEILRCFYFGYIKEEEADECFDTMTEEEVLRYLKNIDTKENKDEK